MTAPSMFWQTEKANCQKVPKAPFFDDQSWSSPCSSGFGMLLFQMSRWIFH
jgi:hypothetical protein